MTRMRFPKKLLINKFKNNKKSQGLVDNIFNNRVQLILFTLMFALVSIVTISRTSAITESVEVGTKKISIMTLPSNINLVIDNQAVNARATESVGSGIINGAINIYGNTSTSTLRLRTNACSGSSTVSLWVANQLVINDTTITETWNDYTGSVTLEPGKYPVKISFTNSSSDTTCERKLYMDTLKLYGTKKPPVLNLNAAPLTINSGETSNILWNGSGANSCVATDSWNGFKYSYATNSTFTTPPLSQTSSFSLTCKGYGGTTTKTATVSVNIPPLTVGGFEIIKSRTQLNSLGLKYWTDGTAGVTKSGTTYTFFAPHSSTSSKSIVKSTGTLTNPTATIKIATPTKLKANYDYYSGGPVYKDPSSTTMLMFTHTERNVPNTSGGYWVTIAMAKSTDGGSSWIDLGEIISPRLQIDSIPSTAQNIDIGGGSYVVIGDYFYVYFADRLEGNVSTHLSVARAKITDVVNAAKLRTPKVISWNKYYNGNWSQPALGGLSSPLENNGTSTDFPTVSYNSYLNKYIMVASADWPQTNLHILQSTDGINWDSRLKLETDSGESIYANIIGTGTDPRITDKQFYVYYTYSVAGGVNRWSDAVMARRLITLR